MRSFMDLYFQAKKWVQVVIDIGEWLILAGTGIFFPNPHMPRLFILQLVGVMLVVIGIYLHHLSHKEHEEAHKKREEITKIVSTGIYSKIRHPGYAAYIVAYVGLFLIIGSVWMLIPVAVFTTIIIDTVIKEEKALSQSFPNEYAKYKRKVPWRFIPGLF